MISRKMLVIKEAGSILTILLENGRIEEIHVAPEEESAVKKKPVLGDIYIAKVENIVPNIGAAFLKLGDTACYYDVSQAPHAIFTKKTGKKSLCIGDELVVQVSREAVKTKAPTVTSNLSFSGHYAVLTTGNTRIGTSSKLPKSLRELYKERLKSIENDAFGVIVRTNAKDAEPEDVLEEIRLLEQRLDKIRKEVAYRTCYSCLEAAPKSYLTDFKNVYMDGLESIQVEDPALYQELLSYFQTELPGLAPLLSLYKDPLLPLGKLYSVGTVMTQALSEKVWLPHGGYLVIQPTEALTVIDVNSGKCVSKKKRDDTWLKLNLEAAREIAHQIRLRNLSGIILTDFVNMEDEEQMQTLLKEFRKELSADPIQTTLVDVTALQLVEVTRKKVRKPLHECRASYFNKAAGCSARKEDNRNE